MECIFRKRGKEPNMLADKKIEWLRALAIVVAGAGIACTQSLVPIGAPGEKLILIAISLAAYATIPVVFRMWPIPGKKEISATRWGAYLALLAAGLVVINFHLTRPWFERHPRIEHIDEIVSHFIYAMGGWLVPLLAVSIGIAVTLFKRLKPRR
jgi:hypothetical protein